MTTPVRLADDRGFTLVELLVTMAILSVVMTLVTGSAVLLQRNMTETSSRFDNLAQARVGMDATTKWLRGAITVEPFDHPFDTARRSELVLRSNVAVAGGGAPQLVQLEVDGGELVERVWQGTIGSSGDWTLVSSTPRERVLARGVIDDEPFTFFDSDGSELTPSGDQPLDDDDRARVRRVGIAIDVLRNPDLGIPASELRNRVTLPNQYYFDQETTP